MPIYHDSYGKNMKDSIYNEKGELRTVLLKIRTTEKISGINKKHILRFYDECCSVTPPLSDHRKLFYLIKLWTLTTKWIEKDFKLKRIPPVLTGG